MTRSRVRERTDWPETTMSEWMEMTPSDWMERVRSGWESSYGELMNTSPSDLWRNLFRFPGRGPVAYTGEARPRPRRYRRGRGPGVYPAYGRRRHREEPCRRCGRDPCECTCCIGDVDLAVYVRAGERRVIPLVIENERRREKEIRLELSDWTTRGGKTAPVKTELLQPQTFTLPPCGEREVVLVIEARAGADEVETDEETGKQVGKQRWPDVDDCLVATADLRLVGCDHRPLRIAVAILPRDCDPYWVTCDCTCC